MEEKSNMQYEESREQLLEELQELRGEVNRLNDKLARMEGLVYRELRNEPLRDRGAEPVQYEQDSYPYGRPPYERTLRAWPAGEPPVSRKRASVIPEMRRQRRENRARRKFYQVGEADVGKYGSAFLAAVCILAGCGLLMVSAWALADELIQAALMFLLGAGMAGGGWLLHQRGGSAVPTTLAACGLGILYMDCVSLHFLWHLVPVEWVLPCILAWAVVSFYMAFSGGTLLFYYVVNLGNLATAILVSAQKEGIAETWAGLLFVVAAYGVTLFQVFRIGAAGSRSSREIEGSDGMRAAGISVDAGEMAAPGEGNAENGPARPAKRRLRWLKNFTAVNVLAAYTILFAGEDHRPLLLFALLLGGIVLFFWRDLYQGGVREEAAGVLFTECQMGLFCAKLTEGSGQWEGAAVCLAVLLLLLAPLVRARNRNMISAVVLYPMLWVGAVLSDLLTGDIYLVSYMILVVYYAYMLLYPAFCKILAFVPAYIIMYFLLVGETAHPEADITFALMTVFALGLPVKYLVKMAGGLRDGDEAVMLTFRQVRRYGVAMLAAFVVCVTYGASFDEPFVLALEAVMLAVFTGMTSWMKKRDFRFVPVLCTGMILLWLMSWKTLEWCMGEGLGLELASGILFLLAGSLSAWCGIRYGAGWGPEDPEQMPVFCPPGLSPAFMVRRLNRCGRVFCPVSLGMFSISLYRFVLVFRIPYAVFVSLILLLAAVVILLIGFWLSDRSVRAYALFLMAVCVVKMVTADLAGTGWVYRAGALAGGGVLCMIVSFAYSHRERREKNGTDEA